MSVASVGGTITGIVGLGVTLGALGLALEFTDRAFDRASPNPRRKGKRKPLFDTSFGNSGRGNGNVFDPMPRKRTMKRSGKRRSSSMMGDFF